MKKTQKGFIAAVLLVILGLLIMAGGVYTYKHKNTQISTLTTAPSIATTTKQTDASNTATITQPTNISLNSNWKIYTNTQYGFSIQDPVNTTEIFDRDINGGKEVYFNISPGHVLTVDIVTQEYYNGTLGSANCNDFDSNVTTAHTTINGTDFVKGDMSNSYGGTITRSSATEYCVAKGKSVYKITTLISWNPYKNSPNKNANVNNDSILNQMIASFKFI